MLTSNQKHNAQHCCRPLAPATGLPTSTALWPARADASWSAELAAWSTELARDTAGFTSPSHGCASAAQALRTRCTSGAPGFCPHDWQRIPLCVRSRRPHPHQPNRMIVPLLHPSPTVIRAHFICVALSTATPEFLPSNAFHMRASSSQPSTIPGPECCCLRSINHPASPTQCKHSSLVTLHLCMPVTSAWAGACTPPRATNSKACIWPSFVGWQAHLHARTVMPRPSILCLSAHLSHM